MLWRNSSELASHGLLLPGRGMASHHQAALELRGASFGPPPAHRTHLRRATWQGLADEANGFRGDVLVSSELLAWAGGSEVAQALSTWPGREVHLVVTLRDLARQVPAVWQEEVKNRRTLSYAEFLDQAVAADDLEGGPGGLWGGQDPRQVLGRWAVDVAPERVHVVTVPPPGGGTDELWTRFCQVLRQSPEAYDTQVRGRNVSVGLAEAELLRQITLALPEDFEWAHFARLVKHGLAESRGLTSGGSERIQVPDAARPALAARARAIEDFVREQGYAVVGDLRDLHVSAEPTGHERTAPDPADLADAGVRAGVELLRRLSAHQPGPPRLRDLVMERDVRGWGRELKARARATGREKLPAPVRDALRGRRSD
ncbi:hypothetical protein [Nocardioides marmoraquaticus]